jgi:hypothetical protein
MPHEGANFGFSTASSSRQNGLVFVSDAKVP